MWLRCRPRVASRNPHPRNPGRAAPFAADMMDGSTNGAAGPRGVVQPHSSLDVLMQDGRGVIA